MISAELLSTVESRYDVNLIGDPEILTGGWWNEVFRLPTDSGALVLRVFHRRTKPQNVRYQHTLTGFLAEHLAEVHAPLVARDNSTFFRHDDDRLVCLLPFLPGETASRESARERNGAARVLARLHRAALSFPTNVPPPDYAPMSEFDWTSNDWWNWFEIREVLEKGADELVGFLPQSSEQSILAAREIVNRKTQIAEERWRFQTRFAEIKSTRPLLTAPTHGDFYAGNVLVDGGGRISAVIDWDEAHSDWLVYELARATWEFCRLKKEKTLDENRAFDFLQNYVEAEGVVSRADFDLLVELMRAVRLQEVLFALAETIRNEFSDLEYTLFNLLSLENLRGVKLTF